MYLRVFLLPVCAICLSLVLQEQREVIADEALVKQFLEDAPIKWKEYEMLMLDIDVHGDSLTTFSDGSKEHESFRMVFDANGTQALVEVTPEGTKKPVSVSVSNPRYKFELTKASGPEGPFAINDVSPNNQGSSDDSTLRIGARIGKWIRYLDSFDLLELVASRGFSVKDARKTEQNGRRVVEIDFEYHLTDPSPAQVNLPRSYSGTIQLLPDDYWAITKAVLRIADDPDKSVSRIEVDRRLDRVFRNMAVITETQERLYDMREQLIKSTIWKHQWDQRVGNDNDFTLSAFGFPEPTFSTPSKRRLWIFSITISLLTCLVVLFVYRRYRRT